MTTSPAPPPAPNSPMRIPPAVLAVCLTLVFLGLLGAFLWESAHHLDTGTLLPIILAVIGAGPGLLAYSKTNEVAGTVNHVQVQTNGTVTRMLDLFEQMLAGQHTTVQQAVAAMTSVPAEPAHPSTTDPTPDAGPPSSASAGGSTVG